MTTKTDNGSLGRGTLAWAQRGTLRNVSQKTPAHPGGHITAWEWL
jgi:hypothetical protein